MTDPIADLLTRIRNGYMAKKSHITVEVSKQKEKLLEILKEQGYVGKTVKDGSLFDVELIYHADSFGRRLQPAVTGIVKISKPGRRVYVKCDHLPRVLGGLGISIISTPQGMMIDKDARKKSLGGEAICKVW